MALGAHTCHGAATSTALFPVVHGRPLTGRVLGASPAGCYLHFIGAVGAPAVVALLPQSSVRLPLAMMSAGALPAMSPDDPVVVGDGALRVGPHAWRPMRWFEPRPPGHPTPRQDALTEAARLLNGLTRSEIGLDPASAWAAAADLALGDCVPCGQLLGAGPGLTPAGDDVVAGALAACTLSGAGPSSRALALLLDQARGATSVLSAALISCAAAGQVVPQAAELLRALSGAVPVAPALGRLRAIGSTSGTALAIGLVGALAALPVRRARIDPPGSPAHPLFAGSTGCASLRGSGPLDMEVVP